MGVDAEICDAEQAVSAFTGEPVAGGQQDLRPARTPSSCRGVRSWSVGRESTAAAMRHVSSGSDLPTPRRPPLMRAASRPADVGDVACPLCTVADGTVDHPQHVSDTADTASDPGDRAGTARRGVRERLGPEALT